MMFLFPNILSNFCVPTLFKEYYEKHSGEAVGRGQTAPMRHPKVSQSFSLGGLTAVNVGKHSNSFIVGADPCVRPDILAGVIENVSK